MKKRILSVLLIATLLISSLMTATVFASDDAHVEFLKSMGVIEEDFNPNAAMTRGEFVALIMKLLYPDVDFEAVSPSDDKPFVDVEEDHPNYAYIKAAKDIKVVNGNAYSNFEPDRAVTATEAIVIIMNAYGYSYIAEAKGGYPTGYLTVAQQTNMLRDVSLSDEPIGDLLLKLVYNSLFADIVSMDSIKNGSAELVIVPGKNMLTERFNIIKFTGVVIDNGIISLEGTTLGRTDMVVIRDAYSSDKIAAYVIDESISGCIGSMVDAYIRYDEQTERYDIISYSKNESSKEISIQASLITNATSSYIEYTPDKDNVKVSKVLLETPAPKVLYNGTLINVYSQDTFKPKSGIVRLADTNNNGKYDLVDILSFNYREYTDSDSDGATDDPGMDRFGRIHHDNKTWNVVVDVIDTENGYISCKQNPGTNNIDIDEDNSIVKFVLNDKVKSVEDIKQGDIISVALAPKKVDGKNVYYLAVSSKSVKGVVTSYTSKTITVNETEYDVSAGISDEFQNIVIINSEHEFMIDALGEIAYVVRTTGISKNYAYLINAKVTNSFENELYVKLFTKEGKIEYLYGAENITIDGVKQSGAAAQLAKLATRSADTSKMAGDTSISRPIIYTVNSDNRIIKIDTDTPNTIPAIPAEADTLHKDFSPILYTTEEIENYDALKAGLRIPRTVTYKSTPKTFDGRFFLDDNTVVMSVPDIDTYGLQDTYANQFYGTNSTHTTAPTDLALIKNAEKDITANSNYKVLSSTGLNASTYYDVQAYDVDPVTGVAGLVVLRGYDGNVYDTFSSSSEIYVFLRITDAYDAVKEKAVKKLYYTKDGSAELSVYIDNDVMLDYIKLILYGDDGSNNDYSPGTPVTKLKAGDLIRVETANGYLAHLDRPLRTNETDIHAARSIFSYPQSQRNFYKTYSYTAQPYDMRADQAPTSYLGGLQIMKPISVAGNVLRVYIANGTYSIIDVTDESTYTIAYYNLTGIPVTVVNKKTDGSVKVTAGGINDIKIGDPHSYVFTVNSGAVVEQCFVLNFEQ